MLGRGLSLAEPSRTRSSHVPALRRWPLQDGLVPLSTVTEIRLAGAENTCL